MKRKIVLYLLTGLLLFLTPAVSFSYSMYMNTQTGTAPSIVSALYGVDPATGLATKIGNINVGGYGAEAIRDIALSYATNTMYAISGANLYSLDYTDSNHNNIVEATAIGTAGVGGRQGLVTVGGRMYMGVSPAGSPGQLYELTVNSPTSVTETLVGSFGTWGGRNISLIGDLAYGNGKLYATVIWDTHPGYYLAAIDIDPLNGIPDGLAQQVGTAAMGAQIDGLAFDSAQNTLYGMSRGSSSSLAALYTINLTSALATRVDSNKNTGVYAAYGMTTAVPLPPTVLLLGCGVFGLLAMRRKSVN